MFATRVPPRFFEALLCCVHLFGCFARCIHGQSGAVYLFSLAFAGIQLRPLVVTVLAFILGKKVINEAICCVPLSLDLHSTAFVFVVCSVCLLAMVHQSELRCLFDTQRSLAVKSKASAKLLSSVCDAACWLAADGTILESDPNVDQVLGCRAQGTNFCRHLPAEERERFNSAKAAAGARHVDDPVVLLPSTLCGVPHQVDLFIEDVRAALGTAEEQNHPGFLVGIRLNKLNQDAQAMVACDLESPAQASASMQPWLHCMVSALDGGSSTSGEERSLPETLRSIQLPCPTFRRCTQEAVREALLCGASEAGLPAVESPHARSTVLAAFELICDHALGGALICVADTQAFQQVFGADAPDAPCTRSSDQGYMTDCLRGIHVGDERFQKAFREFTRRTEDDRWPEDHPDELARGLPKDGAFLLSTDGYRVQCSTKLLGLTPAARWEGVGTKHEAALACAWAVPGASVLIKSDSGSLHFIQKQEHVLVVYEVDTDK